MILERLEEFSNFHYIANEKKFEFKWFQIILNSDIIFIEALSTALLDA